MYFVKEMKKKKILVEVGVKAMVQRITNTTQVSQRNLLRTFTNPL